MSEGHTWIPCPLPHTHLWVWAWGDGKALVELSLEREREQSVREAAETLQNRTGVSQAPPLNRASAQIQKYNFIKQQKQFLKRKKKGEGEIKPDLPFDMFDYFLRQGQKAISIRNILTACFGVFGGLRQGHGEQNIGAFSAVFFMSTNFCADLQRHNIPQKRVYKSSVKTNPSYDKPTRSARDAGRTTAEPGYRWGARHGPRGGGRGRGRDCP